MIVGGSAKWQFVDVYSCTNGILTNLFELDHGGTIFKDVDNQNTFYIKYSEGSGLYGYDRIVVRGGQSSIDDWYANSETGYTPEPIYTIGGSQVIQEEWDEWESKIEQNPIIFSDEIKSINWTEQKILELAQ